MNTHVIKLYNKKSVIIDKWIYKIQYWYQIHGINKIHCPEIKNINCKFWGYMKRVEYNVGVVVVVIVVK